MRFPFVSRAKYDAERMAHFKAFHRARHFEKLHAEAKAHGEQQQHNLASMRALYDELLTKYHELASRQPHVAPHAVDVEVPEPDVPPSVVLQAMKQISPVEDATYRANWAYWEKNKERAAAYPQDFADEILKGEEH